MNQFHIAIAGSYGTKNKGDEGQLVAIVEAINALGFPDLALTVFSAAPLRCDGWRDITFVAQDPCSDPRGFARALARSDLFILGGGTLLDGGILPRRTARTFSERLAERTRAAMRIPFWLSYPAAFQLQHKPTVMYAQGIGEIEAAHDRWFVRQTLNRCRLITVRDVLSKDRLLAAGVTRPVHVTADCAFALRAAPRPEAQAILSRERVPRDRPLIGMTLRPWRDFDDWSMFSAFADFCVAEYQATVVFVPMHLGRDDAVLERVRAGMTRPASAIRLQGDYTPGQVKAVIGELDLVVGMRMHSLIFAGGMRVPMLGIGYMEKVRSFMEIIGLPSDYLELGGLSLEQLKDAFENAWRRREQSRQSIVRRLVEIHEREHRNIDLVRDLLASRWHR